MPRGRRNTVVDADREEPLEVGLSVTSTEFTVTAGRGVLCPLTATNATGTVTWALVGHPNMGDAVEASLPPGLHLTTHGLSGHPTTPGLFEFWVSARDESHPEPQTATALVVILVEELEVLSTVPPLTQTIHPPRITEGEPIDVL